MTHQPVLVLRPLLLDLRTRATGRGDSDMIHTRATTARDDHTLVELPGLNYDRESASHENGDAR